MGLKRLVFALYLHFVGISNFLCCAQTPVLESDKALILSTLPNYAFFTPAQLHSYPEDAAFLRDNSSNANPEVLDVGDNNVITDLSCDPFQSEIYYVDGAARSVSKVTNFDPKWTQNVTYTLVHPGMSDTASNIAIDWLARNLYWTDHQFGWIGVQPLDAANYTMYKILIHERTFPLGIAIEAIEGYMFWFDMPGLNPAILRADLSGQNQRTIVHSAIQYIESMHVDYTEKRLYWLDYNNQKIESVNYFGTDRRSAVRLPGYGLVKIAISGNSVCGIDGYYSDFECFAKFDGATEFTDFLFESPSGLTNCDKSQYPSNPQNPCQSLGCQHICVRVSKTASKCLCQEGYKLQSDGKSCSADHSFYGKGILISNATDICMIEIRVITGAKFEPLCLPGNFNNTRHLAADANTYNVYYYNESSSEIWSFNLQTSSSRSLVSTGIVTGLVHDHLGQNLAWAESDMGKIKMFDLATSMETTLVSGISNLGPIALGPHDASVFWIEANSADEYKIMTSNLDGTQVKVVVSSDKLTKPTALFYEPRPNRLFYLDGITLVAVHLNGSDPVTYFSYAHGTDLLIYGRYSLWIDSFDDVLYATSYMAYSKDSAIHDQEFGKPRGIAIFDAQKQLADRGPCWNNNGGCEGICVPLPGNTRECRCDFGLYLHTDGTSCRSKSLVKDFLMVTDQAHGKVYEIDIANSSKVFEFQFPVAAAASLIVHHGEENRLYMVVPSKNQIISSELDGTNVTVELAFGTAIPRQLAVDYSTGNVYYTYTQYESGTSSYDGYVSVYNREKLIHHNLFSGIRYPKGLALDPADGYMFLLDGDFSGATIYKTHMDGLDYEVLVQDGLQYPNSLTLDPEDNKLYWPDPIADTIERINYDGTGRTKVGGNTKWSGFNSLAIKGKYIYAVGYNMDKIERINKDTGIAESFMSDQAEFGSLSQIAVVPEESQKTNALCANQNGACTSFCLPAPMGSRTCACKDGAELLLDGLSCSGDIATCPRYFLHGRIIPSQTCFGIEGSVCGIECDAGYMPNVQNITCNSDGNWNVEKICVEINCPRYIPNGAIDDKCVINPGVHCSYTCNQGFVKNPSVPILGCSSNGNWNHMHDQLCLPENKCSVAIPNGQLQGTCIMGSACSFTCNANFLPNPAIQGLQCQADGSLSVSHDKICVPIMCPSIIPNGMLSPSCPLTVGSSCTYTCSSGYTPTQTSVQCQTNQPSIASWSLQLDKMCQRKTCQFTSSTAVLLTKDAAVAGETYNYACPGSNYDKNPAITALTCALDGEWKVKIDSLCIDLSTNPVTSAQQQKQDQSQSGGRVSGGAYFGIGVAVTIVVLVIIAVVIYVVFRRRNFNSGKFVNSPNVQYHNNEQGFSNPSANVATGITNPNPYNTIEQPKVTKGSDDLSEQIEIGDPAASKNNGAYSKF